MLDERAMENPRWNGHLAPAQYRGGARSDQGDEKGTHSRRVTITVPIHFYYDYVEPVSYLMNARLGRLLEGRSRPRVIFHPFELCPPPLPMLDPNEDRWKTRWELARAEMESLGEEMLLPRIIPWSRKAHELARHAEVEGRFPELHDLIFRAYHLHGKDIGRVDVLVELAGEAGLDRSRTKAVLDVDRYGSAVGGEAEEASRGGVRKIPAILGGEEKLEGCHAEEEVLYLLRRMSVNPEP